MSALASPLVYLPAQAFTSGPLTAAMTGLMAMALGLVAVVLRPAQGRRR